MSQGGKGGKPEHAVKKNRMGIIDRKRRYTTKLAGIQKSPKKSTSNEKEEVLIPRKGSLLAARGKKCRNNSPSHHKGRFLWGKSYSEKVSYFLSNL